AKLNGLKPVAIEVAALTPVAPAQRLDNWCSKVTEITDLVVGDLAAFAANDEAMRTDIGPVLDIGEVEEPEAIAEIELATQLRALGDRLLHRRTTSAAALHDRRDGLPRSDRSILVPDP